MKVLLRKGHHSVYDDLVRFPPDGVEYVIPKFLTQSKSKVVDVLKKKIFQSYLKLFNKPHSIYVSCKGVNLIHACSGIMIKNKFPWIIDTEHVASFVGFEAGRLERVKSQVEDILSSKYCRKIMPWTNAAKTSILNGLDTKNFREKIETVYPAIHPVSVKKQRHDKINLLFISVRFYTKGGKEVLEAYELLGKKYDIGLTIISEIPRGVREKYPEVKWLNPRIPRDVVLKKYFSMADIFVLPSYMDTFGMVFLEAMSLGIPIVSTNVFAVPEIVGKAGLLIDVSKFSWYGKNCLFAWKSWDEFCNYVEKTNKQKIVNDLIEKLSLLIEDSSLRKKMGRNGKLKIEKGKFSIKERNKKLKRIYEEALKVSYEKDKCSTSM
jgi:glycosyltransferase involved in cell wall biosynthesis